MYTLNDIKMLYYALNDKYIKLIYFKCLMKLLLSQKRKSKKNK